MRQILPACAVTWRVLSRWGHMAAGKSCCDGQSAVRTVDRHASAPGRAVTSYTSDGIAYDREGPRGELPVVLIHVGVADRRMWTRSGPRLPGAGRRAGGPAGIRRFRRAAGRARLAAGDVLAHWRNRRRPLSSGRRFLRAGVAVEGALTRPSAVASLLLAAPGGSLLAESRRICRRSSTRSVPPWVAAILTRRSRRTCRAGSRWRAVPLARSIPRSVSWSRACSGGRSR